MAMKRGFLRTALRTARAFGIDPVHVARCVRNAPHFVSALRQYRAAAAPAGLEVEWTSLYPILADRVTDAGVLDQYFHQDLWAARKVFARRPARHVDVGSRLDGFVAHLLTFMPVTVVDVRPLRSGVEGLDFLQGDATDLPAVPDGSLDSLSSLHAVEHFGLGRYGDPIDPQGCFKAMRTLARVLAPGGRLYFSVPVGRERLEFNAHRVLAPRRVLRELEPLRLVSFSGIDGRGRLLQDVEPDALAHEEHACGLFELTKA